MDTNWVPTAFIVGHIAVILAFLLTERRAPSATFAWLMLLTFLPVVGVLLYFFFGATRMSRLSKRCREGQMKLAAALARHEVSPPDAPGAVDAETGALIALGRRLTNFPATDGNAVTLLASAAATYRTILRGIKEATDHIHVEFYIIKPDRVGKQLREALTKRAQSGVEVRVLYDAVGSGSLPSGFWQPLEDAGGQVAAFNPIRLQIRARDRVDFRNHRKIVVFDGKLGLTGGINVGREYLGLDPDIGHWRDSHVRIEGPAVMSLQQTFAADWLLAADEVLDAHRYYPKPVEPAPGNEIVDIIESGPDKPWSTIHKVFFQAMCMAKKRVWITSPYFVPDPVIEATLTTAALRGVDVRLLLPSKSDVPLVTWASRSYYPRLMRAGAKIYEYQRGFLHAKQLVVDDWMGTIGSANMDIRSFKLNFEVNAVVYSEHFVDELARHFLEDLSSAKLVEDKTISTTPVHRRLLMSAARLLSPLL